MDTNGFLLCREAIGSTIKLQTATVVGGLAMVDQAGGDHGGHSLTLVSELRSWGGGRKSCLFECGSVTGNPADSPFNLSGLMQTVSNCHHAAVFPIRSCASGCFFFFFQRVWIARI